MIVSLALGTIVTLLASLRPALRATRVPPIAAVREGSVLPPSRFARFGPVVAVAVCAVALAVVAYAAFGHGMTTGNRLLLLAVGVLGLFIGVAMVAPSLARPLASVLGRPATLVGGVAGDLARSNSMRNPSRTASTAAALMIGLALVTVVAVLAQGLKSQFESAVSSEFHADYALTSQNGFTADRRRLGERAAQVGSRDRRRRRPRRRRPGVREDDPGDRRRAGALPDDPDRLGRPGRTPRSRASARTARSSTRATPRTTTSSSARRSGSRPPGASSSTCA